MWFDGIRRGNYFGGEPIGRVEIKVSVGKMKIGKDEFTGEREGVCRSDLHTK